MNRDLAALQGREFDLLVVGGGIHGACVARDAALRGLSVALVEQADFCSATSHNSLKTIHGGIRYLQHLNFKRAIESIREQQVFLRTAPHLVEPLRFLMPTYGFGMRGPLAMAAGIGLFELLTAIFSMLDDRTLAAPKGRLISPSACKAYVPGIETEGLTGGAIWADAQVALADKAVLQILQHAVDEGALVSNYVQAVSLLQSSDKADRACGAQVKDVLSGDEFPIKARMVVNASGPWLGRWMQSSLIPEHSLSVGLVKSMNLVTTRPAPSVAIGFKSARASDSKVGDTKRLFFSVPWQGKAVIGTTHFTHHEESVDLAFSTEEIESFLEEFNAAYPEMKLGLNDVLYCYQGLTPGDDSKDSDGARLHASKVVQHESVDGVQGVISIVSIKWTTARLVAEQTVDAILALWNDKRACRTREQAIPDYSTMPHEAGELDDASLRKFVLTHIVQTQAQGLGDIVLRRTNDLALGKLNAKQVKVIALTLAEHFQWTPEQMSNEVASLLASGISQISRQSIANEFSGAAA